MRSQTSETPNAFASRPIPGNRCFEPSGLPRFLVTITGVLWTDYNYTARKKCIVFVRLLGSFRGQKTTAETRNRNLRET